MITLIMSVVLGSCALFSKDPTEFHAIKVVTESKPLNHNAVVAWPFVFIHKDSEHNIVVINHENIHVAQYRELGIIGFPFVYLYQWLKWACCGDEEYYYMGMTLELEAYLNQWDLDYLKKRKPYSWKDL